MKNLLHFFLNLLKSLFNVLSKLNNKEGVLLEKIINEANFSISKSFGELIHKITEICQVQNFK